MPKSKPLFNDSEMRTLRRLYYEQAPTIAGLIMQSCVAADNALGRVPTVSMLNAADAIADRTVELIEALVDAVGEVTEDGS